MKGRAEMERLPADRQGRRRSDDAADAPVLDRPAIVAAARRVVSRMPAAVAASAAIEVPIAFVALLLPFPWPLVALGVAWVLASGPVLALVEGTESVRDGLRVAVDRGRDLLATASLEAAAVLVVTIPAAVLWLLLGMGPFGAYLTVLAFVVSGSRLALALPALVLRELSPTEALELSWDLVDGVAVEVAALFAAAVVLALGPPIAIAVGAPAAGLSAAVVTVASAVALAVTGPLLPLVLAEALPVLEARRRAVDPKFGRP